MRAMNKVCTADEAVALIEDGQTIATSGFIGTGVPEALLIALKQRYQQSQQPQHISLVYAAGQGDGKERGLNHLAQKGMVKRIIGGHWGLVPKLGALANENELEAYNFPQGVITHLYRDIAAGKPGTLTHVGLNTFADPRVDGGKLNAAATEDLVEVMTIAGKEYLFYQAFPIHVALLRGTTADAAGNITMQREALTLDGLAMAQAAKNCGGRVLVQVEQVVERCELSPQMVKIPGVLVDAIVLSEPEHHMQTYAEQYNPVYTGEADLTREHPTVESDIRLAIGRIAAAYLKPGAVVNLGIGMPEAVAMAATENGVIDNITLTVEPGGIGGIPASGLSFGATANAEAIIDQANQFDFYDGGGLDQAFLGMAEVDQEGNVNVSRFGTRMAGAGGFINISQNAREVYFMGAFTSGKQQVAPNGGKLNIQSNGPINKFVEAVQHLTFSGQQAIASGQVILYITERAVFRLSAQGLMLEAVAPGIDIQKDILNCMDFIPMLAEPVEVLSQQFFE